MVVQVNDVGMELRGEELRIGNLLYFRNTKDFAKVELIHNKHFDCRDEYGSFIPNGEYEPIPLTEKILENNLPEFNICSFRKECWVLREENSQFHIIKHKGRFIFRGLGMSIIYVDTLHHLQNLVFVNTGQELNVKL